MRRLRARNATSVALAALLCVAAAALPGCAQGRHRGGELNGLWVVTAYASGGVLKDMPSETEADAKFSAGQVSGHVFNSYRANFVADEFGRVTDIGPMVVGTLAGPPDLMTIESAYLADLEKAASYYATATVLTLYDSTGATLIEYQKSTDTVNGNWRLTAYSDGATLISPIATTTVTVSFGGDGRVTGNGGVNTYFGDFTTSGTNDIAIGALNATQLTGPSDAMDQERDVLTALQSAKTFAVSGTRLNLRDAAGAIVVQLLKAP